MYSPDLRDILSLAADSQSTAGIIFYLRGNSKDGLRLSYSDLHIQARLNGSLLQSTEGFIPGNIVLLHFNDHLDNVVWFWSVLFAGGVPAISTPFSGIPEQRVKHIRHLDTLLRKPVCITRSTLLDQFDGEHELNVHAVESLNGVHDYVNTNVWSFWPFAKPTDTAFLMLTSGSTGMAKAVRLSHIQILTSISSKASVKSLPDGQPLLNWVGLDHVAGMLEIHLLALYLNVSQIHVPASDIIADPLLFLELIDRHRVARTFAPNFFLHKLKEALESASKPVQGYDLSCLQWLGSGGEANPVKTCEYLTTMLTELGAPKTVIVPGFGMTETCAGAIYNLDFPCYDSWNGYEYASLGVCMPGIEIRVISTSEGGTITACDRNEPGELQLRGLVVFTEYYNNPLATLEAFTSDGWFRTGDQAIIDPSGNLRLTGRIKDTMTINGVKYLPQELDAAIDAAAIPGVLPGHVVSFSFHSSTMETEQICICYLPDFTESDTETRVETHNAIIKTTMLQTGSRPYVVPLDSALFQKSTLGKLSRSKMKTAFLNGDYKAFEEANDAAIREYNSSRITESANELEEKLLNIFSETLNLNGLGVDTPVFNIGVTSIDLIRVKRKIEQCFAIPVLSICTIMTNPTVRALALVLREHNEPRAYEPVVPLKQHGEKVPLWLIHPGVGEVLVFLGLASYIDDRPVYALRARGFENNEPYFESIEEIITTYHTAIKKRQPAGPYALAGYSYGAMLAFETAKLLEHNGDEVRFLASLNLPPHIKLRMRQLDWATGLLHLAYFLGLITENHAHTAELTNQTKDQALAYVASAADPARMAELSLTTKALANWADLTCALQGMGRTYEPSGSVAVMDVFVAEPLKVVAASRHAWREEHLHRWVDFCQSEPRFHDVEGSHYTMLDPMHVQSFLGKLTSAMRDRGL